MYVAGGPHLIFIIFRIVFLLVVFILPIVFGFTLVRGDANRIGQPGWLWAVLSIPFGWFALLIYAILRPFIGPRG
jgi:hypothetical protein